MCSRHLFGSRPDASALRRRYNRARDAAGAPVLPFHGLRHTAASLFIRKMDPVEVKAIMGRASIKTTERYLHAQRASDLVSKVTDALTPASATDEDRLTKELLQLDPGTRDRLLELMAAGCRLRLSDAQSEATALLACERDPYRPSASARQAVGRCRALLAS
jgi:hypothetical protein